MGEIFNLEDEKDGLRMRIEHDIAAASPRLDLGLWASFRDAAIKAFLRGFDMLPMPIPQPVLSSDLLREMTGKPNIMDDLSAPGKKTLARYYVTDSADKFNKDDNGHRAFRVRVYEHSLNVDFFHGDLKERNGELLEMLRGMDGHYRPARLARVENGMEESVFMPSYEEVEHFMKKLLPAMNLQASQMARPHQRLQLVTP